MKRLWPLLLALTLLCACGKQPAPTKPTQDASAPEIVSSEELQDLTLLVDDGHVENPWDWSCFYWFTKNSDTPMSISLTNRYYEEDNAMKEYHSTLTYDGEVFTLTEAEGTFTYKYLVYSSSQMPPQSNYDFAEYFLLSDDPEMTADTYFSAMLSSSALLSDTIAPTRIVYSDYHDFDRAEAYGDMPETLQPYLDIAFWESLRRGEDVAVSNFFYPASDLSDTTIFAPTEADRLPPNSSSHALLETTDGYVLFRHQRFERWLLNHPAISYLPSYCEIIATGYDADGNPLWQATSPIFVQ